MGLIYGKAQSNAWQVGMLMAQRALFILPAPTEIQFCLLLPACAFFKVPLKHFPPHPFSPTKRQPHPTIKSIALDSTPRSPHPCLGNCWPPCAWVSSLQPVSCSLPLGPSHSLKDPVWRKCWHFLRRNSANRGGPLRAPLHCTRVPSFAVTLGCPFHPSIVCIALS